MRCFAIETGKFPKNSQLDRNAGIGARRHGSGGDRRGSDREVLGLGVVDDYGGSRLLGVELVFLRKGDADLVGAQ